MFNRWRTKVKGNSSNQILGRTGENLAETWLKSNGFKVLERNFRTRHGEIDLVATQKGEVYFVEVKTRSQLDFGHPLESLPWHRVERLKKMAQFYVTRKKWADTFFHVSLLGIDHSGGKPEVTFIKDIVI